MAILAEHLIKIKFLVDKLRPMVDRAKKDDDTEEGTFTQRDSLLGNMALKRFRAESAATFFTHIDEIIALMPPESIKKAKDEFEKEMEEANAAAPDIGKLLASLLETLIKSD